MASSLFQGSFHEEGQLCLSTRRLSPTFRSCPQTGSPSSPQGTFPGPQAPNVARPFSGSPFLPTWASVPRPGTRAPLGILGVKGGPGLGSTTPTCAHQLMLLAHALTHHGGRAPSSSVRVEVADVTVAHGPLIKCPWMQGSRELGKGTSPDIFFPGCLQPSQYGLKLKQHAEA